MANNNSAWLITAKANLHAGNENVSSYGLIDKVIQRDVLTQLPCIHSSSLKGALNEYCTVVENLSPEQRINIFGVDKTAKNKNASSKKGFCTFFDANILLLPVQDSTELFHWITTESILQGFIDRMNMFSIKCEQDTGKLLDSLHLNNHRIETVSNEKFSEYCIDEELPIIARNCLEDGQSTNLWYEQVLPRETVFYTLILSEEYLYEKDTANNILDNKIIQIGANATIGYGYCRFTKIK